MTESPMFWIVVAIALAMGARGLWLGFSASLARLQLMVLALVFTGALLNPLTNLTRNWLEAPLYFQQLVVGALLFSVSYLFSCKLLTWLFNRGKPVCEAGKPVVNLTWGSRLAGALLGLLAGLVVGALIAFLSGIRADFNQLTGAGRLLADPGELSAYGYGDDAFETASETPLSQLINTIVVSPDQGVRLLQQTARQPEFQAFLDSPEAQLLLAEGDLFGLAEEPTFDQLIATAPVQSLWGLQRELVDLTDRQLRRETAAQMIDVYQRIDRVRQHPRVAELLASGPIRDYLQTAELAELVKDARVLELGDVLIGAR